MSNDETKAGWPRLLRIARDLIRQVNLDGPIIEHWTLGGGTALMLRIGHRQSRDIDIFLNDPQQLYFLDPTKRDLRFETPPSDSSGDGARFLRFVFENDGEIDFIAAVSLTSTPSTLESVEGEQLALETIAEIIVKKICHRGALIKPRDIFDIAAAGEDHADDVIGALGGHKAAVQAALSTLEKLNRNFVLATISQLVIQPRYAPLKGTAIERAKDILRAVA